MVPGISKYLSALKFFPPSLPYFTYFLQNDTCNVLYLPETLKLRVKQNSALHDLHSLGATSFVNCPTAEDGRPPVSPQGPDVIMVGLHQPKMGGGGQSLRLFSLV